MYCYSKGNSHNLQCTFHFMNPDEKYNIVYITSNGHSGSTILDLLLETILSAFSVGEVFDLENACEQEDRRDDTGALLSESAIWGDFCKNIDAYSSKKSNKLNDKNYISGFVSKLAPIRYQYDDRKLFEDIYQKAKAVKEENISWVIDSSKSPLRMISINEEARLDTKTIHLIRSPWGVTYSHAKRNHSTLLACWRWIRTNLAIAIYLFFWVDSDNYIRVYYGDLCANTSRELQRITDKFDIEPVPDNYIDKINNQTSYRFAGNSLRHKEIKEIRYDDKWKEGLSLFQKVVVGITCGPLYALFLFQKKIT